MEEFNGLFALLITCLEIVLIINLIVFTEKNNTNRAIIFLMVLLLGSSVSEFAIGFYGPNSNFFAFLSLASLGMAFSIAFLIVVEIMRVNSKLKLLSLLPGIFFLFYFVTQLDQLSIVNSGLFFCSYEYSGGNWFGLVALVVIVMINILLIIWRVNSSVEKRKVINLLLATFSAITFMYLLLITVLNNYLIYSESILSKIAILFGVALTYFAIQNKD